MQALVEFLMSLNIRAKELDYKNAINAVRKGVPVKRAALLYGVSRSTLQDRLNGKTSMKVAKERFQRFSPSWEACICCWFCFKMAEGQPPTNKQIQEFAQGLLSEKDEEPLGRNWITGFLRRNRGIQIIRGLSVPIILELPHDSQVSYHWHKALYSQRIIFDLAKRDTQQLSTSEFDFRGATQTYQTLKCSIMHFKDKDFSNGGLILMKAFKTLEVELSEGNFNVVQDISLNLFRTLVRYNYPDIGTLMLKHCSELFSIKDEQHPYCRFFKCLSQVFGTNKAELEYYLSLLTKLYAEELEYLRGRTDRSVIQARRRDRQIVRDSKKAVTIEDTDEMINSSESLLKLVISQLGPLDDKALRIENETLRMQSYVGNYEPNYISRVEQSISKIEELYASEQVPFKDWSKSHQSAFLRFLERKFDYYKHSNDQNAAIKTAGCILENEGYQTERWIVFSLQFESWLRDIGDTEPCSYMYYRLERLKSNYYQKLAELSIEGQDLQPRTISELRRLNLY